ncbi:DUF4347 domain-containing protein [Loktanella agnita]|uniref:DUF4347 domain-containing protein n=1 Tax=Loktanella agnita TaxID=287097 RepID=UPI0039874F70
MRIDVVDTDVGDAGLLEPMASFALTHLARERRAVVMYLATDTWQSMIGHIIRTAGRRGVIDVLQIHSHGTPGTMFSGRLNAQTAQTLIGVFRQLTPYFAPDGQVFLKGCETGQAPALLRPLAQGFGVPVTAGFQVQFVGGASHDVFIGGTATALPGDSSIYLNRAGIPRRATP